MNVINQLYTYIIPQHIDKCSQDTRQRMLYVCMVLFAGRLVGVNRNEQLKQDAIKNPTHIKPYLTNETCKVHDSCALAFDQTVMLVYNNCFYFVYKTSTFNCINHVQMYSFSHVLFKQGLDITLESHSDKLITYCIMPTLLYVCHYPFKIHKYGNFDL